MVRTIARAILPDQAVPTSSLYRSQLLEQELGRLHASAATIAHFDSTFIEEIDARSLVSLLGNAKNVLTYDRYIDRLKSLLVTAKAARADFLGQASQGEHKAVEAARKAERAARW